MNELFFADVDLPFHVWVRERTVGPGFRWVLREAAQLKERGTPGEDAASAAGPPRTSKDCD